MLSARIYRNGNDCTNGGITSPGHSAKRVTIVNADGPSRVAPDAPPVILEWRRIGDWPLYPTLFPAQLNEETGEWEQVPGAFMFGGNFAYASDSRFPSTQPIAIHDRQE